DDKDFEPADAGAKTTHGSASSGEDQRFSSSFSASVRGRAPGASLPLASVSSFKPSLKARMPLAASPMMPDSLPRPPNRTSTTTTTMAQCQMLMEPMAIPPQGAAAPTRAPPTDCCASYRLSDGDAPREAVGIATMNPNDHVIIHTDGACKGNPGPGGWGAILQTGGGHEKELWGGEALTTNNRMELMAAIMALDALKRPCRVDLHTDSKYVMQGVTEWIRGWKARGWKTADKKPVKNEDLWRRLDEARSRHEVKWHWVKGHAGHALNERADGLANRGVAELRGR